MAVVVVVPPAAPLIDLEVAKAHLRVEHGDHDVLIAGHINACADWLDGPEGILGRALGMQTLRAAVDGGFRAVSLTELSTGPVRALVSVDYRDAEGMPQIVADGVCGWDEDANRVRLIPGQAWPAYGTDVSITYTAGYSADALPASIKGAILLHLNILYDQPEDKALAALERARDALLSPKRKRRV